MKIVNNMLVLEWEELDVYFGGKGFSSHFESCRCDHYPLLRDCPHCDGGGNRYSIPNTEGVAIPVEKLGDVILLAKRRKEV